MNKNEKRPQIIIYKEGKKYNSVDDMDRRNIKSIFSKKEKTKSAS